MPVVYALMNSSAKMVQKARMRAIRRLVQKVEETIERVYLFDVAAPSRRERVEAIVLDKERGHLHIENFKEGLGKN